MPTPQPWNEKEVFIRAAALSGEAREQFLRQECPKPEQMARIRALLEHHARSPAAESAAADPGEAPPPEQIEEFRIERVLGAGGMGVVYLARDTTLDRAVALKVLAPHLGESPGALTRFRQEARSLAALNHPAIVPIYRFGFDGRRHYIVSEFVNGPTLEAEIARRRSAAAERGEAEFRPWARSVAGILAGVADALDGSHRAGLIHRDVKPSNILLDPDRGPRLTDFGIAWPLARKQLTEGSAGMGTCHYMSPEQAAAATELIDERSDIFSLGVVMYECLSFRKPFDGASLHQVLSAVLSAQPPALHQINRLVSRDMSTICAKAMEKAPERRYQTAAHMAADLRCALAGLPILARPPGAARRAAQFARRHRPVMLLSLVVALAAATTLSVWAWAAQRRSQLGTLRLGVEPGAAATRFWIAPVDPETGDPGAFKPMAGTGSAQSLLRPGAYRLLAVRPDGTFIEFDELLERGGTVERVLPASTLTPTAEEVLFETAEHALRYRDPASGEDVNHRVRIPAFYIDVREVNNGEYQAFLDATGRAPPPDWSARPRIPGFDTLPVAGITQEDAREYARWVGKRLPTMREWLAAAQWPDARLHPWGEQPPPDAAVPSYDAVVEEQSTDAAELWQHYTARASISDAGAPSRLRGMWGGVSEFTSTVVRAGRLGADGAAVVIVGSDWSAHPRYVSLAQTGLLPLRSSSNRVGFRCARSAQPPEGVSP